MSRLALILSSLVVASAAGRGQSVPANGSRPVVSPDGRHIALMSGRDGTPDLYVIDADGSSLVRLTNTTENEGFAGWSADGARVMFFVFRNDTSFIYSVNRDGSGRAALGYALGRAARVTPDGSTVVAGAGPWPTMQLFSSTLNGANRRQLTPGTSAFWCHAVSSDGRQIAASRADSGHIQVWSMNVDGTHARQVTHFPRSEGGAQCPSWSFDGRRLAVQSAAPDPRDSTKQVGHVWVIDVATGAATKVAAHTDPYLDETPTWFPNGKQLAFQSDRTGRWEIWVVNVDGTGLRQVTR